VQIDAEMQTRELGTTGLVGTPIGLGMAALGRPGYLNLGHGRDLGEDRSVVAMERHAHAMLDTAYQAGIRHVDAARSYGRAEEFVASWLDRRNLGPDDLLVSSKWGYAYTAGWRADAQVHEVKDHSLAALRRQAAESREILGDHLKLYQIHSATLETGVLEDAQVLSELANLRSEGLVIGLSVSGPRQADTIRRALEVETEGVTLFASVQATWNLLEPSVEPALAEAHEAGWAVIVKEAVANGRLTPQDEGPSLEMLRTLLRQVAQRHGVSVDALAMAAAMAQPWADVVLSGAVNEAQLRSNLSALDIRLSPSELAGLAALAEPSDRYWSTRSALPWN
jgi:aryl-alcohol dehydrogenase-like predicted oxidoreductase